MTSIRKSLMTGYQPNESEVTSVAFRVDGWDLSDVHVYAEMSDWPAFADERGGEMTKEVVIHVDSDEMARAIRVVTPDGATWRLDLKGM